MEQDADVPRENVDSTIMKSLIDLFYCFPSFEETVEDLAPQIHQQIIMWRHLDMDTHNRTFQYVIDVFLRIIMILTSEATAERTLLRQSSYATICP
jgi:hypothetical protein